MHRRALAVIGAACAVGLALSACGNSGNTSGGGGALKIGVLTSLSGAASAGFGGTLDGVRARLAAYTEDNGKCADRTVQVFKADDASTPQGALAGEQKLVQQDKVFTVLEVSALWFGASQWATTAGKGTPVIGGAFDGSKDWLNTKNNLLPAGLVPDYDKTYSTEGQYFKSVGGTKIAGLAYANPASQAGLESGLKSAEAAGLKRAYVNTSIPIGSTDVGAIVLGIIRSKADVINMGINVDTALAVVAGLKQAGYKPKAILSATGYGADLLDVPAAVQIGQGVTFLTNWQPTELNTPATQRMARALKVHAGSKTGIPSFSQAMGWLTADLFLHGLEKAGCNASQAKLLSTMRNDKSWDANGLYPVKRDFTSAAADKLCIYFVRMKGAGFVAEPKATPICGTAVS